VRLSDLPKELTENEKFAVLDVQKNLHIISHLTQHLCSDVYYFIIIIAKLLMEKKNYLIMERN
jgi:hypothetical protein